MLERQPAGDLLGRPSHRKAGLHQIAQVRLEQFIAGEDSPRRSPVSVGVGGSLLIIGSASGIVAMSKVKELTFVSYLKYVPALFLCYSVGYALTLFLANRLFD